MSKHTKKHFHHFWYFLFVFLFLAVFYFFYDSYASRVNSLSGQVEVEMEKKSKVLDNLSEVFPVPEEIPVVAEIDNAYYLQIGNRFYRDAKDGDFVLLFNESNMIIIFDNKSKKVINVGKMY